MNAWPTYRDGVLVEISQTSRQRLAIRAAQAGNWKPADSLELDRLRREVKPHYGDGEPSPFSRVRPAEILRQSGPNAEDTVLWVHRDRYQEDAFVTDLDGLILEDRLL